jgi:ribosome-binding protein aMBF1 (putative translation factor)
MNKKTTRKIPVRLGKMVRRHREELGLSQKTLAEEVGVSRFHVINIEHGRAMPRYDEMVKIKKILQIPADVA